MISVTYGSGTTKSKPSAVAFLWRNWEVFFQAWGRYFEVRRLTDTSWRAKGFGGVGEWHLVRYHYDNSAGMFVFYSYVKFLGFLFSGESTFRYKRISDDETWYFGIGFGEIPKGFRTLFFLFRPLISWISKSVAASGGKRANELTANDAVIVKNCG